MSARAIRSITPSGTSRLPAKSITPAIPHIRTLGSSNKERIGLTISVHYDPIKTAFTSLKFDLKMNFSINSVPEKLSKYTIFQLFDDNDTNKKFHYSLSVDEAKNLLLEANNQQGYISGKYKFSFNPEQFYLFNIDLLYNIEIKI
jgi:hypothetical protein